MYIQFIFDLYKKQATYAPLVARLRKINK